MQSFLFTSDVFVLNNKYFIVKNNKTKYLFYLFYTDVGLSLPIVGYAVCGTVALLVVIYGVFYVVEKLKRLVCISFFVESILV